MIAFTDQGLKMWLKFAPSLYLAGLWTFRLSAVMVEWLVLEVDDIVQVYGRFSVSNWSVTAALDSASITCNQVIKQLANLDARNMYQSSFFEWLLVLYGYSSDFSWLYCCSAVQLWVTKWTGMKWSKITPPCLMKIKNNFTFYWQSSPISGDMALWVCANARCLLADSIDIKTISVA